MQNCMSGSVCGGASALCGTFAIVGRHPAKWALINFPVFSSGKRDTIVFKLDNSGNRFTTHIFDGILITQPVRPLDGVVHVPFPGIWPHITKCSAHATLRCDRVAASWEHLSNTSCRKASGRHAQCCSQASATSADDDHIMFVFDNVIRHACQAPRVSLRTETIPTMPNITKTSVMAAILIVRTLRSAT